MSPASKSGSTLRGLNPPGSVVTDDEKTVATGDERESSTPRLLAQEFYPLDLSSLEPRQLEQLKQGKIPEFQPPPLAGSHQRVEPVDPTPVDVPHQATDYAAPRPLPAPTAHKTLEVETIKVDGKEDPRKANTQPSLKKAAERQLEEAAAIADPTIPDASLTQLGIDPGAVESANAGVGESAAEAARPARGWVLGVVALAILVVAGWFVFLRTEVPPATTTSTPAAPTTATTVTSPERVTPASPSTAEHSPAPGGTESTSVAAPSAHGEPAASASAIKVNPKPIAKPAVQHPNPMPAAKPAASEPAPQAGSGGTGPIPKDPQRPVF